MEEVSRFRTSEIGFESISSESESLRWNFGRTCSSVLGLWRGHLSSGEHVSGQKTKERLVKTKLNELKNVRNEFHLETKLKLIT
jgi:hypothetical protein